MALDRFAVDCISSVDHSVFSLDFFLLDHMRKRLDSRIKGFFQSSPDEREVLAIEDLFVAFSKILLELQVLLRPISHMKRKLLILGTA